MLLRSDRTYPPEHLGMEIKLNLIFKELRDLKLREDGLESKSDKKILENCKTRKENHNDRRRDENTSRSRINEDDIICRIKIYPLTFDNMLN